MSACKQHIYALRVGPSVCVRERLKRQKIKRDRYRKGKKDTELTKGTSNVSVSCFSREVRGDIKNLPAF